MHALANSILEVGGDLEQGYAALNKRQYDLLYIPLRAHRNMGNLPPDFDVETAREILELINHALFEQRIGTVPFDIDDYRSKLLKYIDLVMPYQKPNRKRRAAGKR